MRKAWIDYLRITAALAVITGHVIVVFYQRFGEISLFEWWFTNILGVVARISVGLFVMISGAVLLGRNYTLGEFYKRRMTRLVPPLIVWNLFYVVLYVFQGMDTKTLIWLFKAQIFADGYAAPHLWYLSMFICLMLFVPFINQFIKGEKPTTIDLAVMLGLISIFFVMNFISSIATHVFSIQMDWFKIFPWYIAYFIGGYYIDKYGSSFPIKKRILMLLIILLIIVGALLNYYFVSSLGIMKNYLIMSNTGPLALAITVMVFLLAKKSSSILTENRIISILAEASFGVYLIHEAFNGILIKSLPEFYSAPLLYGSLVIGLSAVLSFASIILLRKIPLMKAIC